MGKLMFFFFLNSFTYHHLLYQCMGIEMFVNDQALTIPYRGLVIVNDLIGILIYLSQWHIGPLVLLENDYIQFVHLLILQIKIYR